MASLRHAVGAVAVVCSLSCSFAQPREIDTTAAVPTVPRLPTIEGPHGPSAIDWIESRFHRYPTGLSRREVRAVAETIVDRAESLDLGWPLILAVIKIESGYSNFARSNVGALGLMQIMPRTGEMLANQLDLSWYGPETLFDPVVNVRMGTAYLRELHDRFGSWQQALAAYNWGPGAIRTRLATGRVVPAGYATKVLAQRQSEILR